MTETEWLTCTNPTPMLEFLRGKASDRKLRLFACACCRRIWSLLGEADRRAVEMAESYADALVGNQERRAAAKSALIAPAAILCISVNMAEELPHLEGSVATRSADSAAKMVAMKLLPSAVSSDSSVTHLRAVERLVRSKRWQKAKEAEQLQQSDLLRDILGNPFCHVKVDPSWLAWNGSTGGRQAQSIYDERAFDCLPVLADTLKEAGCTNADILDHCRQPGDHVRGCWVVDLLLGKS